MASSTRRKGSSRSTGAGYIARRLDGEGFSTDKVKEIVKLAVERQQDTTTRLKKCKIGQICQGDPAKPSEWRLYSPRHPPHIEKCDWYDPRGVKGYPTYVILDDQAAANVLESGISNKDRHYRWPGNFTTSGALPKGHVHRGRAGRVKDGRYVCIEFKEHAYVFHGKKEYQEGDAVKIIQIVSGRAGTELTYHLSTPQNMQKAADIEALEAARKEAAEAVPRATAMLQQASIITTRLNEELECASTALSKCKELAANFQYDPMSYDTEQERCEALRRMMEDLASWRNDLDRSEAEAASAGGEDDVERAEDDEILEREIKPVQLRGQLDLFMMQMLQLYQDQMASNKDLRIIYEQVPKIDENHALRVKIRTVLNSKRKELESWRESLSDFKWLPRALDLYLRPSIDDVDWSGILRDIDEKTVGSLRSFLAAKAGDDGEPKLGSGSAEDNAAENMDGHLGQYEVFTANMSDTGDIENAGTGPARVVANGDIIGNEVEIGVIAGGNSQEKSHEKRARRGKQVDLGVGEGTKAVHEQAVEQQDVVDNATSAKKARKAERKALRNSTATGEAEGNRRAKKRKLEALH